MKGLLLFLVLAGPSAFAADVLVKEGASPLLREKLGQALEILPPGFLSSVKGKIEIEEAALSGDKDMHEDLCAPHEKTVFGHTVKKRSRHQIKISAKLVQLAATRKEEQDCSHGSFDKFLLATIIHELTHVKDNTEKLSLDPDFQRIVGVKRLQKNNRKRLLNQNSSTSPDAYEFTNLQEALAVNVEYLLLDPEFECRKPATANFLARRLGVKLPGTCQQNFNILTQSAYLEDNYQQKVSIDPSRVYQVHYLFAGKGRALMSRWGHAMFRLVICAPFRKKVGPDCMRDVSHHLALSYRAYMSDVNVSYLKGLSGVYPSQLFIMRFHEVQQEYTKFELRDLFSIPLKLTETQKADFIDLTLERFWTYQGKYYFLDNNCGTETQKHLAMALDEEQARLIRSITPLKIYKDILSHSEELGTEDLQGMKRHELVARGVLIESLYGEMEESYKSLRSQGLFREKKFKKFLKKTKAEERLARYEDFFAHLQVDGAEKKLIIMRLIFLERYLSGRFLLELPKKVLEKMHKDHSLKDQIMQMSEGLKLLATQPWDVVDSAYGVPSQAEFASQWSRFLEERQLAVSGSLEEQVGNLQSLLKQDHFRRELQELGFHRKIKRLTNNLLLETHEFL